MPGALLCESSASSWRPRTCRGGRLLAPAPSGTGHQVNVLGVLLAAEEGFELNVLGATVGINPARLSLQLPIAGRLGRAQVPSPRVVTEP